MSSEPSSDENQPEPIPSSMEKKPAPEPTADENKPAPRINLRTPEVMAAVQAQVENHYRSEVVEKLRAAGGTLSVDGLTIKLAKQFGFCYGVERAIDLAYASRKVFGDKNVFILGEIIHNPEVNEQIRALGIKNIIGKHKEAEVDDLKPEDVVIVPAFGTDVTTLGKIKEKGCKIVDTTCGDVMSVWKRVRQNANDDMTSIIHGKASHEETMATASRAIKDGKGHYLVVLTLADTDYVGDYIRKGGDKQAFLERFKGAHSPGFDPDLHLRRVGVANQTTMMRGETEEVQRRVMAAIRDRDGDEKSKQNYRFFDTICGATQERQDALQQMLDNPLDLLLVVGGYNSSNTSHLAEMGEAKLPTYFIRNASRLESREKIVHYDLHKKEEVVTDDWLPARPLAVGITAGASCPNNLIEDAILRLFELHGISGQRLLGAPSE
jgi:4-hydroxy-3-methylbut-2-en-1-yl diphosphate reductase